MESCITTNNTRRHCFVIEDDGLASIAETTTTKAEFSGNNCPPFVSRPIYRTYLQRRSNSFRNLTSLQSIAVPSPRRSSFDPEPQPHFLDACFLCKKPLGDRDIFMYRGDTPFCSEECRQEQIDIDEAKEKINLSASMKALRKKDQRNSTSASKTPQDCSFRTSTVAAA